MVTLATNRWVPPGSYLGQIISPEPGVLTGTPRIPCYVGAGSRLAKVRNAQIRRSYIYDENITLTPIAPYVGALLYPSDKVKRVSVMRRNSDGNELPTTGWWFNSASEIQIDPNIYDPNDTYSIDYQSTSRDVSDLLPVDEIRAQPQVGRVPDTKQYDEYVDYLIPMLLEGSTTDTDSLDPDPDNTFYPPGAAGQIGVVTIDYATAASPRTIQESLLPVPSAYIHPYNRKYVLTCTGVGVAPRTATFNWYAVPASPGNSNDPCTPYNPATVLERDVITFTEIGITNVSDQWPLEYGLMVELNWVAALPADVFEVGDVLEFEAIAGSSLIEFDARYLATNQFPTISTVSDDTLPLPSDGIIELDSTADFTGTGTRFYKLKCISIAAGVSATFDWCGHGDQFNDDNSYSVGSFTYTMPIVPLPAAVQVTLEAGIVLSVSSVIGTEFAIGDLFSLNANSGRIVMEFKDDRDYELTVTSASYIAPVGGYPSASVGILYNANTREGGAGNAVATTRSYLNVSGTVTGMPGNTKLYVRNIPDGDGSQILVANTGTSTFTVAGDMTNSIVSGTTISVEGTPDNDGNYTVAGVVLNGINTDVTVNEVIPSATVGASVLWWSANVASIPYDPVVVPLVKPIADTFTYEVTNEDLIDWSLDARSTETIPTSRIIQDVTGAVTGSPLTWYIVLKETPVTVLSVTVGGSSITYSQVTDTPYIWFLTEPTGDIEVNYEWRSNEPAPGSIYYLTANYLRPDSWYNTPTLFTSFEKALDWLEPMEVGNNLMTMLSIIETTFDAGLQAIYLTQVKDSDDDGIYTDVDFRVAINSCENAVKAKDLIVLDHWGTVGDVLAHIDAMYDPFVGKERLGWFGAGVDTPVGDEVTPDTLVYYAANTFQVYGKSPSHGSRVLVAPTWCKYTVGLDDGTTQQLTLDGSFVAGYMAARTCSFAVWFEPLLRKTISVFDEIETFEEGDNNTLLGPNGLVFLTDQGASVYRIEQSTTTDDFAPEFHYIEAMTQKQGVTVYIRDRMDRVVGVVPASGDEGAKIVKGLLGGELKTLLGRGLIADYQTPDGAPRDMDVDRDIRAWRDETSPTLYHYNFAYWLFYPIERAFGLYRADSNDFGRA